MITVTIDGREIDVPDGTNLIEAARAAGIDIPYFCYHPHLSIVGQCRICMVEIEGMPRLAIACATPAVAGMVVRSETSDRVREARDAVMEFLLANHPLDCPVCDQAGECLLQDHAFSEGSSGTHMVDTRRTFPGYERRLLGPHIIQNQNRCIHCSRCIRFTREISETAQLTYKSRGNRAFIDTFDGRTFDDPFSACTADVCPVGALTVREFRFRKRAWKLRSTPSVCPGCSIGCTTWLNHHERTVFRFTPRQNPDVNATWLCDYGRFQAESLNQHHHLYPAHRLDKDLERGTWQDVVHAIGDHLRTVKTLRVVASANLTNEELFLARELFAKELKADLVVPVASGELRRMKNASAAWHTGSDAHPNSSGARRLGLKIVDTEGLSRFVYGAADLTIILDPLAHPFLASEESLQLLRVGPMLAFARTDHPLASAARWLLPTTSLACEEGSFTSSTGVTQRVSPAYSSPGESRPLWSALVTLARELGLSALDFEDPAAIFIALSRDVQSFSGLTWGDLGGSGRASYREHQHVG